MGEVVKLPLRATEATMRMLVRAIRAPVVTPAEQPAPAPRETPDAGRNTPSGA